MPFMIVFGIPLFAALVWQIIQFAKGRTAYPRKAAFYNMVFGTAAAYIISVIIGNNIVGNGIATAAISIGHLWMFGMLLLKMPDPYKADTRQDTPLKEIV